MIKPHHLRAGFHVLRRHLRYARGNPKKLWWLARRAFNLAREGAIGGVLERHAVEAGQYADYAQWYGQHEQARIAAMASRLAALPRRPLISILLPVFDPPPELLAATIASVRAQHYAEWELCVVDDASSNPAVIACLHAAAAAEPRIHVERRTNNGGIAVATNGALAAARGEFCAFLDHDDTLAADALLSMAEAIAAHPDVALLFSDEDKLDANGNRTRPFFKPAWDSEWVRTTNCVLHFMVVRTSVLRELGGITLGVDGAQDWDVVLRVEESAGPTRLRHLPHVLYHWRELPGSTAAASFEKPRLVAAQCAVIEASLQRRGETGVPRLTTSGWRIEYAVPQPRPLVSIVIPTRDRVELLRACIESVRARTTYSPVEMVIVDNHSREPAARAYLDALAASGEARVVAYALPFNYAAQCNLGVRAARGTLVALLNNDIEVVTPGWLDELVSLAVRPRVGLVGATLYYPDGTLQHAGVVLGLNGVGDRPWIGTQRGFGGPAGRARAVREVSAMITACAVVMRERYLDVGGMNETLAVSCNDLDLCLRFGRAGYRHVITPHAELVHHESASRGYADDPANAQSNRAEEAQFAALWPREIADDPLYNPNLSLEGSAYALAWPPRTGSPA